MGAGQGMGFGDVKVPATLPVFSRRSSRPRRGAGQIGSNSLTRWPGATSKSWGI
jgi:hypothetical protein